MLGLELATRCFVESEAVLGRLDAAPSTDRPTEVRQARCDRADHMQAIEWEREPCLVLGTLGKMFGVLCEIDFLDETSLPRTAWLRTRVAPPLRRQFHEAVEQACRPLVRVITRRGVDVAAMSDDQHEWSPTFERSIRGITLASPLFCNARIPPPLSLVRLNALMATETMAEPSVSDTFFHCTLRALNIYCQHGDLSAFGTDAVLTSAILAGYTAYMDAMPSSTESDPPPFFQHAELLSLQRVCCDQASFGAALARSPALEVAEHATMVLQRTGCVNQTFLLGSIIGECWMYMSESALAGRVARGVVESVLRAILVVTDELAVEVGGASRHVARTAPLT